MKGLAVQCSTYNSKLRPRPPTPPRRNWKTQLWVGPAVHTNPSRERRFTKTLLTLAGSEF